MAERDEDDVVEIDPRVMLVPDLLPGDRCKTEPNARSAEVRFVGKVPGMRGFWVGVQYDEKVGKNDGVLNGKRYFRCPAGHGGFVRGTKVTRVRAYCAEPGSQPPEDGEGADATALGSPVPRASAPRINLEGSIGAAGDDDGPISPGPFSSPRTMRGRHTLRASLETWHRDVAPNRPPDSATPDGTYAFGPGLEKAIVGSLSQFTILAHDKNGARCERGGGDDIKVHIRGRGALELSQPGLVRTKIIDRADGSYMCEYQVRRGAALPPRRAAASPRCVLAARARPSTHRPRARLCSPAHALTRSHALSPVYPYPYPSVCLCVRACVRACPPPYCVQPWLTGQFTVWITLDGVNIKGSPYDLSVITLRPEASRCVLRGAALTSAVARQPMKFEVLFVEERDPDGNGRLLPQRVVLVRDHASELAFGGRRRRRGHHERYRRAADVGAVELDVHLVHARTRGLDGHLIRPLDG